MSGILYLVATPIGNLEDLTLRALRILREADVLACEDTRHTRKLLAHFGIEKPLVSYHEHNERTRTEELLDRAAQGETVALVSDAGSPLISDPGYRIVQKAIERGLRVEALPGPCAAIAALSASGLPTDAFYFAGFLPPKSSARRRVLAALQEEKATLVFYEAPHRLLECLADLEETLGPRQAVVARELTKLHEEFLRGTLGELRQTLAGRPSIRGECTIVVDRAPDAPQAPVAEPLQESVARYEREGLSRMDAIKRAARDRGIPKSQAYRQLEVAE